MADSIVAEKSFAFALRIIKLYQHLVKDKREFDIGRQILRSGTSIGANIEEALGGYSENDFAAKISISYKESRETAYWLRLLKESNIIDNVQAESLIKDCDELTRLTGSIVKTMKKKKADHNNS